MDRQHWQRQAVLAVQTHWAPEAMVKKPVRVQADRYVAAEARVEEPLREFLNIQRPADRRVPMLNFG